MDLSSDHKPMSDTEKSRIHGAGGFVNAVRRGGERELLGWGLLSSQYICRVNSPLHPNFQQISNLRERDGEGVNFFQYGKM